MDIGVRVSQADALFWATSHSLSFPVLYDENAVVTPLFLYDWGGGTFILPHTCIVDNQQIMRYTELGYIQGYTIDVIEDTLFALFNPVLEADLETIEFGVVELNESETIDVTLDNTGTGKIRVTSASVSGDPFSVSFTAGDIYAVEDEMIISVTFTPTEAGDFEDELLIESTAGNLTIPVTGTGQGSFVGRYNQEAPDEFRLYSNHPNPFNAATAISFALAKPAKVTVEVFDIKGASVALIDAGEMNPGSHSLKFDASDLNSGVYFYRLNAGEFNAVGKMVLLK